MAKTKLKRMDRFELLELIYNMRKANLDLTERLEAAEKKIVEVKEEADRRVEEVRAEYVQRIDDLRMHGSAKELQKRMSEIEEQLIMFQRLTGRDAPNANQESPVSTEQGLAGASTPPAQETLPRQQAPQNDFEKADANPLRESGALAAPGSEAGESRE